MNRAWLEQLLLFLSKSRSDETDASINLATGMVIGAIEASGEPPKPRVPMHDCQGWPCETCAAFGITPPYVSSAAE